MDWKLQLGISIVVPLVTSLLTYFAAQGKSKADIKAVQINADTEIKKIKEESDKEIRKIELEYQKQIEKMKVETEEQIKLKMAESELISKGNNEQMKNEMAKDFIGQFMTDPKKGGETFASLVDFAKKNGMKQ